MSISCSLLTSIYYCNGFSLGNLSHLGHNINKQNPAKLPNLEPNAGCVSAKEVVKRGYYQQQDLELLPKECVPIACAPPPKYTHWNLKAQCDGVWGRLGHKGGALVIGIHSF